MLTKIEQIGSGDREMHVWWRDGVEGIREGPTRTYLKQAWETGTHIIGSPAVHTTWLSN